MIRTSDYDYWVWRHNQTGEPACLVRNSVAVPFSACCGQVHEALSLLPDVRVKPLAISCFDKISFCSDERFTVEQWNTWHAFGICPTIQVYVKSTKGKDDIVVWGWMEIKS